MKTSRLLFFVAVIGLTSLATAPAQDNAKNLAITPALHPGTEKKHESFNEISKLGKAPLVFLGDSITAGWSGRGKEIWKQYWEPLGAANFGIGGDRTEHILWRLDHGNYNGLKPKLTVLMIGTNNTGHQGRAMKEHGGAIYTSPAEQTAEGVTAIVKQLREKQPQMKILLLAIFPRGATPDDKMRRQNEATNQLIAKLADGETVHFLDINEAFLEADGTLSKEIMPDLLHPNAAGYQIWAEAIDGKVKELMGDAAAGPVITKETREENGKKVEYMFIDGIKVHETDPKKQPQPPVVEPKPYDAEAAKAPADAVVLFDGSEESLKNWTSGGGKPTKWKLVDGALESVKGGGYAQSKEAFGSCRLHIEFATPAEPKGNGQGRGNSGVFLMGEYEVQVLDSYENTTYPDGQCGALYGRSKPLVNASRAPGEWQTFDITFHRPLFDEEGNVTRKARFHVVHNGWVIQDDVELTGGTGWRGPHSISEYRKHGDTGPIKMQDHGNPVRFRNIWVQKIED